MTGVLIRRPYGDTEETHREEGHMTTETEIAKIQL